MRETRYIIDFETTSTQDLKTVGIRNYVHHPETQVSIIALKQPHLPYTAVTPLAWTEEPINEDAQKYIEDSLLVDLQDDNCLVTCIAHNAVFEREVFKKMGWPQPHKWIDTQTLAYMAQAPGGLAAAGKALGCLLKIKETKPLLRKAMRFHAEEPRRKKGTCCKVPYEWRMYEGLWFAAGEALYGALLDYAKHDVLAAEALYKAAKEHADKLTGDFPEAFEGAELTVETNNRGIRIDEERLEIMQEALDYLHTNATIFAQQVLGCDTLQQKSKALKFFREQGLTLEGVGAEDITVALHKQKNHPAADLLMRYAQLNKSSLYKLKTLANLKHKGRLYDTLSYAGAYVTGRWSGKGFQIQNLPRPSVTQEEVDAFIKQIDKAPSRVLVGQNSEKLVSAIRTLLLPDDGETLVSIDLSQIELRLSAYHSRSPDHGILASGGDVYATFGELVYGYPIRKGMQERDVAKEGVLSLQYGSGATTFQRRLLAAHKIDKPTKFCKDVVVKFRERNHGTVEQWKKYEQELEDAYYTGEPYSVRLASGRYLWYGLIEPRILRSPQGRQVGFDYCYSDGRSSRKLWGGIVYQNIIQAEARDVFLCKLVDPNIRHKYKLLALVHDEAVFSVKRDQVSSLVSDWEKAGKERIEELWPGLVLESEASVGKAYYK